MIDPRTEVRQIMTSPVIRAKADTSLETLAEVMFAKHVSAVPIVDDEDRPIGIVSKTDLVRVRHEDAGTEEHVVVAGSPEHLPEEQGMHEIVDRATAGEIMTPMVFSVRPETPIAAAAALMAHEHIHRVGVIDAAGKLIGVVSALDVMEWLARGAGYIVHNHLRAVLSTT